MNHPLEIEILSPVHIGSGRGPLVMDLDFARSRQIYVLDQDRLFASLPETTLRRAMSGSRISSLVGAGDYGKYARYSLNVPDDSASVTQVFDFVKTGSSQPYIPGSSLKGAIRTAIAWGMVKSGDMPVDKRDIGYNPRFADDPLMARLFGSDPNHDLLRAIRVRDTQSVAPDKALELSRVQLYNLMGSGSNPVFKPKVGFEFFVETLRRGVKLVGEIQLDDFLLSEPQARQLGFEKRTQYLRDYMRHCNHFAKMLIVKQRKFFSEHGLQEVTAFYDELDKIADSLDEKRACLLQISWGTGWDSKTIGDALGEELVNHARAEFRLGRSGQIVFPKTRRVVVKAGKPDSVMGWVKITRVG